ncbi:hypothetical protein CL616_01425 [archaeon]|nr:hypothetical protein [archaeon]|tara:strand:+ start:528 stop:752 length:225 start_codon:yes stop_codon:yes gene_type:complete
MDNLESLLTAVSIVGACGAIGSVFLARYAKKQHVVDSIPQFYWGMGYCAIKMAQGRVNSLFNRDSSVRYFEDMI